MARKFIEGFESGGVDLWTNSLGAAVVASTDLDMDGSYCLELVDDTDYVSRTLAADSEMYGALLFRLDSAVATQVLSFYSGSTILGNMAVTADGYITLYVGASTLVATSAVTVTEDTTNFFEFYYKLADSPDGRFVIKLNGVTIIDFTGDTKPSTETTFDAIRLGYAGVAGRVANGRYDNFILDDAAYIGLTKVQAIYPTAAGTTDDWTPSAGDNYACVDERPVSDTDYVSTNTVDHLDSYTTSNLSGTIVSIKAVQVQARIKKDGAATPQNAKLALRSGTTDYLSADNAIGTSYGAILNIWETDPDTAAAWIEAGVNGIEIGIKSAA